MFESRQGHHCLFRCSRPSSCKDAHQVTRDQGFSTRGRAIQGTDRDLRCGHLARNDRLSATGIPHPSSLWIEPKSNSQPCQKRGSDGALLSQFQ